MRITSPLAIVQPPVEAKLPAPPQSRVHHLRLIFENRIFVREYRWPQQIRK